MKLKVYTKDGSNFTEQEFENIPQFEGDKGLFALKETLVAYQAARATLPRSTTATLAELAASLSSKRAAVAPVTVQ